jgi:hypothetical protein
MHTGLNVKMMNEFPVCLRGEEFFGHMHEKQLLTKDPVSFS